MKADKVAVHKYPLKIAATQPVSPRMRRSEKISDAKMDFRALDREAKQECLAGKRVAQQESSDKFGM